MMYPKECQRQGNKLKIKELKVTPGGLIESPLTHENIVNTHVGNDTALKKEVGVGVRRGSGAELITF